MNNKPKKLSSWQISTNNIRFNNELSSNRRNLQHHISSSLLPIKINNKISSNISSINNIQNIRINLRASSTPYINSQDDEKELSSERIHSQQNQSSNLIENIYELTRECTVCLFDKPLNQYKKQYNKQCKHIQRTICDICIYNYIKYLLENINNDNIICPEPNCTSIFNFENIRFILLIKNNFDLFERYDHQITYKYLENSEEFVWCAHKCGSGQFHDMGIYSNSMFICIKCSKRTCAYHRIIWHEKMTCEEYNQLNILSIDYNTQIWLKRYSKKCPQCQSYIEKISGCDHMTCRLCKYQFCWQCFADYKKIQIYGLKQHKIYCIHYPYHRHLNKNNFIQRSTICSIL